MSASGSGAINITNNSAVDSDAAWSPDGTRIAFTSNRDGPYELHLMAPDGSGQAEIPIGVYGEEPAWSPDGTRIAFTSYPVDNYEVSIVGADGLGLTNASNDPADDYRPEWQPVPVPSVSVGRAKTKEGKAERFRVTLSEAPAGPLTFAYRTAKGTAKPRKDFTPKKGAVTFATGQTTVVVKVKTRQDVRPERNETFFLKVTGPEGVSGQGKAKIRDND
jgi:dipeptidyl aminopeptidase/acylaminoacyl peptidase